MIAESIETCLAISNQSLLLLRTFGTIISTFEDILVGFGSIVNYENFSRDLPNNYLARNLIDYTSFQINVVFDTPYL